ncbi:replication endonuclease [Pseudoduganella armeniaca]|uniref:Replication endonuclease n=1 Tax=Pseudoduganella armeniaca TaxID=2072590 RepID=A0A2R4CBG2_9BURK|nr:replication endonuclease [Pseudoduganella armeniaca]AVR96902.1 replication endonuclease [Pseudoduganella armeniaca]
MPTIQQENGRRSIKGLPSRWGVRAYNELKRAMAQQNCAYDELADLLDDVTNAPLPIDATDAQLCVLAERSANECANMAAMIHDPKALRARLAWMVTNRGIEPPAITDDRQFMLRTVDPAWWRRNLRRVHGRAFEHAAIRLGFVSVRAGAYASNETVQRRMAQTTRNARMLRAVTMENEHGHEFSLAELAAKGVGNKAIRRGELMLRMAGCEEIANEHGHAGVFVTLTCPSKYHAVLAKSGTINPNYNNATPREAQKYLTDVWACIRAKNHRDGIAPYGFRIAEPHHDGCPHWHLLLFVPAEQVDQFIATLHAYALAEDGEEAGAKKNRVKIVRIDASKGTAAGYIAKYVGKNIDGEHVGEHLDADGNVVAPDLVGDAVIAPSQRVEAWASAWGIRQFQAVGQPPVTVWRELRRVAAEQVADAPEHVQQAWAACQRVTETDEETGEVTTVHAASYADYIRAQGGVNMGRDYRIAIAARVELREGRYGLAPGPVYLGVYSKGDDGVYASTRYEWKRAAVAPANGRPWTGVNNCTADGLEYVPFWEHLTPLPQEIPPHDDSEWYANFDFAYFDTDECKTHFKGGW